MSKHWDSDEELARYIAADELARAQRSWPQGATAGLLIVALTCIGLGALLYQVTGPRTVVEGSVERR